ncbi:MAG: YheU family protein [Pseudomonadales bacterium]|nr:YheU family protein [Halioglobus sp.]MCP5123194.1 YheU family protein [Pseudomonadales bacterium]MCP5192839.1 YheU family protein [Pseudomonadales bacterium]
MTQFVEVPPQRLQADVLQALLEEYASRDGTDYGARELSLEQKVASLRAQMARGDLLIVYEVDGEHWDLLPREAARNLIAD